MQGNKLKISIVQNENLQSAACQGHQYKIQGILQYPKSKSSKEYMLKVTRWLLNRWLYERTSAKNPTNIYLDSNHCLLKTKSFSCGILWFARFFNIRFWQTTHFTRSDFLCVVSSNYDAWNMFVRSAPIYRKIRWNNFSNGDGYVITVCALRNQHSPSSTSFSIFIFENAYFMNHKLWDERECERIKMTQQSIVSWFSSMRLRPRNPCFHQIL